jgi:hypothetical protein
MRKLRMATHSGIGHTTVPEIGRKMLQKILPALVLQLDEIHSSHDS